MTATEFKAKCLQVLDEVNETGDVVEITKHGKVVAQLSAKSAASSKGYFGFYKDRLRIVGDVMEPAEGDWEVLRDPA